MTMMMPLMITNHYDYSDDYYYDFNNDRLSLIVLGKVQKMSPVVGNSCLMERKGSKKSGEGGGAKTAPCDQDTTPRPYGPKPLL